MCSSLNHSSLENEQDSLFEGQIISEILRRSKKKCKYYYFRTEQELKHILALFSDSDYRYLHLSCHGNEACVSTTFDEIPFARFGDLLRPYLRQRRLFVSACSAANSHFADCVMPKSGCYSILGPQEDIRFSDAVILWSSFYHVMFRVDSDAMKYAVIRDKAQELANLYRVPLTLIDHEHTPEKPYSLYKIAPGDPFSFLVGMFPSGEMGGLEDALNVS